jgi:8-oxo-dGTP pyrophosphatase MutT (NUDIX family)
MEFDKDKRPKLGIGVMILNEYDEVICSQRLLPNTLHHQAWQFPGGYQEYGESWE